jgi:predicted RNase H-like HicB family nuclease
MLSKNIVDDIIFEMANNKNVKFLFCGDAAQLNPVNENISEIFKINLRELKLNKIIRAKNNDVMKLSNIHRIWQLYDANIPMISKLIVVAQTREEAILKMKRALDEYIIEGVKTTIPFHQKLMENEDFKNGNFTTKFMETFDF